MIAYHILNGDSLADYLRYKIVNKNFIICRECLIDGDVKADTLTEFWKIRAKFIADSYRATEEDY